MYPELYNKKKIQEVYFIFMYIVTKLIGEECQGNWSTKESGFPKKEKLEKGKE